MGRLRLVGVGSLAVCTLVGAREVDPALERDSASQFARVTLRCVHQEYPNKPDHVMGGAAEVQGPRAQHPAFYGCFDWHSSVHGHWMLVRLLREFPDLPEAAEIQRVLDGDLAPGPIAAELAYFRAPGHRGFERTYGWAWLLKLAAELKAWDDPRARTWSRNLQPLADAVAQALARYLARLDYPIRVGTHANTAFSLSLAMDYARTSRDERLGLLLQERSRACFGRDRNAPIAWEPSGEDFLSPSLEEASLMAKVLPRIEYRTWLKAFLPRLVKTGELEPARVSDRTDPRIVHLDGLNLSRARALYVLAGSLAAGDPQRAALIRAADRHARASLPHIASGSYEGEHWLATFAVYMLDAKKGILR